MPAFRRVESTHAGPRALGILVPPGQRTFVILRPRAVEWDLLPVPAGVAFGSPLNARALRFCDLGRDEAAGLARRVQSALAENAADGGTSLTPLAQAGGYLVGSVLAGFLWIVCRRSPGQPYRPFSFATREEAQRAADELSPFLCPAADANQEYYFNTQYFSPV